MKDFIKKLQKYIALKRRLKALQRAYSSMEFNARTKTDYAMLVIYSNAYNNLKQQINDLWKR